MNFKPVIFIALAITSLQPVATLAMGERPQAQKISRLCDMSGGIKKFVLTSEKGEVKETFKVPVSYMSMELERNGSTDRTLHLSADLDSVEPICRTDGKPISKTQALQIKLAINLRPTDKWGRERKAKYSSDRHEEIELERYPNVSFKGLKNRPTPIMGGTSGYGYIQASPTVNAIPVFNYIECELLTDMQTLNMCRIRFLYNPIIAVTAMFHAKHLGDVGKVYTASSHIVKKFHVKRPEP
jgi:hypothetical protein